MFAKICPYRTCRLPDYLAVKGRQDIGRKLYISFLPLPKCVCVLEGMGVLAHGNGNFINIIEIRILMRIIGESSYDEN